MLRDANPLGDSSYNQARAPMALTPGTRLGPYEVTAQIGVGGMGEVYGLRHLVC